MSGGALHVVLTQTRSREPLATVDLPGHGADMTPAQLRVLARVLLNVANDCEQADMTPKRHRRQVREYVLQPSESEGSS